MAKSLSMVKQVRGIVILAFMAFAQLSFAQLGTLRGLVVCTDSGQCDDAIITLEHTGRYTDVNENNQFVIANLPYGRYHLIAFALGYATHEEWIILDSAEVLVTIQLRGLEKSLDPVVVQGQRIRELGISRLKEVEGTNLYAAKKTEVVQIQGLQANLSTNNARQVFGKISGLNIWESDAAGLQLGVGGRGLSPNRTANFNVRQNGYDISADALGYPEAYYTPSMEALDRIEVLRGAASLQYGTQFGGMLNFVTKEGVADKKCLLNSRQTLGSFGYFGSFNSLGGTVLGGKLNYYAYLHYKRGDSWRENSGFESFAGSVKVSIRSGKGWEHRLEYTGMAYLAQQAGGLTDAAFEENPQQSFRSRNWFQVRWHLPSWTLSFRPDSSNTFEWRNFGLIAERSSLGNLERINRLDLGGNRNLIQGEFKNIGQEFRWLHQWKAFGKEQHSLLGYRAYLGSSTAMQGDGNDGNDAAFYFLNPDNVENSDYRFHNVNLALFYEQIFRLGKHWVISPGIRGEYIKTAAEGYYRVRLTDLAGNIIVDQRYN
ncbi:MAG: TonB-dependent receptor plug domain-containing protein, partial [Bacteroidota bacterium]|nr:TonB-dependent receptor plug domain-containing protein [Bacteroidota bacterium]MDX5431841.1 TonB-dependent receptor plug domain-containing protein [Bacteroidota bacterium]MDX5470552.1 TonB-dependent receptor plug domain-containing protein [Bacteroidota bacterium]